MKKVLLTMATMFVALCANAQFYGGGTLCYKSVDVPGKSSKSSATSFKIAPELGYNINEMWAVGVGVGYMSTNMATQTTGNIGGFLDVTTTAKLEKDVTILTFSPYIRNTLVKSKIANLFVDGMFNYTKVDYDDNSTNAYGFGICPGVLVKLSDSLSFVTRLGGITYASSKDDTPGAESRNGFEFNLTSLDNVEFGLYFNL